MNHELTQIFEKMTEFMREQKSFVLVTLVSGRGSIPQVVGAKALVDEEGLVAGTVGGGKVEMKAIFHATELIRTSGGCELHTWNLQRDVGMTCGGEVQFLFETYAVPMKWTVAVFGAGHVAQALVRQLLLLDCQVVVVDSRTDWLEKMPTDPRLKKVYAAQPYQQVAKLPDHTFFVLMSQGHAFDLPVLAEVLKTRSAPYVGVIGSAQKAKVLRRDLEGAGVEAEKRHGFFCPIGLTVGDNTPSEISISVVAQLLQVRDKWRRRFEKAEGATDTPKNTNAAHREMAAFVLENEID